MEYKFKAKSIKTGKEVIGDLVHVQLQCREGVTVPMIVQLRMRGGMVWVSSRHEIDESTLELVKDY